MKEDSDIQDIQHYSLLPCKLCLNVTSSLNGSVYMSRLENRASVSWQSCLQKEEEGQLSLRHVSWLLTSRKSFLFHSKVQGNANYANISKFSSSYSILFNYEFWMSLIFYNLLVLYFGHSTTCLKVMPQVFLCTLSFHTKQQPPYGEAEPPNEWMERWYAGNAFLFAALNICF